MRYRPLGNTGLEVSVIGFGCGGVGGLMTRGDEEHQREAVSVALDAGINYFDSAAQYGDGASEINLGRALRSLGASPCVGTKIRVERSELAEVTETVRKRLEAGLSRLGLERVDVLTLHTRIGADTASLDAAEACGPVAAAMRSLVATGKAGAIGFTGLGETEGLHAVAASGAFDTFQCYFNVLNQSAARPGSPDGVAQDFRGLLEVAREHGLGAFCIRALAAGALTGTERHVLAGAPGRAMARGEEYEDDLARAAAFDERLIAIGGVDLTDLALRFALSEEGLSCVLVGFSDVAHIEAAVRSADSSDLSPGALEELRTT